MSPSDTAITGTSLSDLKRIAARSVELIANGTLADFAEVVDADAVNREANSEPPATRARGPAAFYATAQWLREAFSELNFDIVDVVAEDDLTVTYCTMSGRHTGPMVIWTPQATIERAFAPTGKTFCVHQAHFQRIRAGRVVEHWAVRDDQTMALQLGWVPPTPWFLLRCAVATSRARRSAVR